MANPAHEGGFPKVPRLIDRAVARKAADAAWRKVCRAVDLRDKGKCRACGRRTTPTLSAWIERREHHHVLPRSLGGATSTANVVTLCLGCHTLRHVTRALDICGNADKELFVKFSPNPSERSPR